MAPSVQNFSHKVVLFSPVLYLFYNATILTQVTKLEGTNVTATGFVDDIGLLAIGTPHEEIVKR